MGEREKIPIPNLPPKGPGRLAGNPGLTVYLRQGGRSRRCLRFLSLFF